MSESFYADSEKAAALLVGRKVLGVVLVDETRVRLDTDAGPRLIWLDGDCCSYSYFTDAKQFDELVGTTIAAVEERRGSTDSTKYPDTDDKTDSISWHFLVFTTNKGHVTIDWRNDSNGYYDGTAYVEAFDAPR